MGLRYWMNPAVGACLLGSVAFAQQGPEVPCVNCPEFSAMPKPETGIWGNPQQSGSGFMLEVQNESVGGFYFLYDETGQPIWYVLSGVLELDEAGDALWVVEADLEHVVGGACLNCPYQPPELVGAAGTVRFEFLARNFGRFSVDGGPVQNLVPLTFGVSGWAEFAPLVEYLLPDLSGEWVFHWQNPPFSRPGTDQFALSRRAPDDPEVSVFYDLLILSGGDILIPMGTLSCLGSDDFGPVCRVELDDIGTFSASIASFGDARIVAESENGLVLQAFRLNYD